MKRILLLILPITILLIFTGCSNKESVTHVGVNAEILEISKEVKGMVVKSLDKNSILGEKCYINCENEKIYFIYTNNITGNTIDLKFEDFIVGDQITVDVNSVENRCALTSRVQLLTQRN